MKRTTLFLSGIAFACVVAGASLRADAETITDSTPVPPVGALGGPDRDLTPAELDQWTRGRRVFDRDWRPSAGLGRPDMNGDSCRACHQDPIIGGAGGLDLNVTRFGFDNGGIGPFQDLPGGQIASRLRNPLVLGREEAATTADVFETRNSPSLLGLGLVDRIPAANILANEDPTDSNGDLIRGVARFVSAGGLPTLSRFGWKAQVPSLDDFLHDALGEELGITTVDNGNGFGVFSDADPVSDPEITTPEFEDVRFFLTHLAAPPRAGSTSPEVALGEQLFATVGCAQCHIPSLDSPDGPVPLYSDLLLHDVHPTSFRGMAEPGADVGMYRTPPLWGIRLSAPYFHDGASETLLAAVLRHDGEAANVRAAFVGLSANDQAALIRFLEDL
ncbi:MAG: di-heme oxidoredictase family protein [Planctomycetota bacterium]